MRKGFPLWQGKVQMGRDGGVSMEDRFEFGENWKKLLGVLSKERIAEAEKSLSDWLEMEDLTGKSFLDIGSGSGLFSLAARNLGAEVFSFDYDPESVACTSYLKEKFFAGDNKWHVGIGDILNEEYLSCLDKFDIVYSWGVLHHTGNMYQSFENVDKLVADNGKLFIAIYNDQGRRSRQWRKIKRSYNRCPKALRFLILFPCFVKLWFPTFTYDFLKGKPFATWKTYVKNRGMSPWRDVVDWVGGYPFEVAKPEEVFDFFHDRGYILDRLKTDGKGLGCNQFVFQK